jgi:hypothetical protein
VGERTILPPTFQEKDLNYYLRMVRGDFSELEELQTSKLRGPVSLKNIVILLSSKSIGGDKKELGRKLLLSFLQSLINSTTKPKAIVLMNQAVHLSLEPEPSVGKFVILEEQGCKIMVCLTSADEYGITDKIKVGFVASMDEICEQLLTAWKVISL